MSNRPALRALQLLTSTRWAIQREALERMIAIAERDPVATNNLLMRAMEDDDAGEGVAFEPPPRRWALLSEPATEHAQSERIGVRDGVAILSVVGPLCRYASFFQEICGMSSYQLLAEDFRIAIQDPHVRAIMLHLDSPGGETNGCAELAALIHANRGKKPIIAMVSDAAASAAYWIAAAADEIVVSPSAFVGSIGVYFEIHDWTAAEAEMGLKRWTIVSSQSPNKVLDPADAAGKAVLQREVDEFADAFLSAVAEYRGTTPEALMEAGHGGAIVTGRHAVERGLADRVATTEDVLAELAAASTHPAGAVAHRATRSGEPMKKTVPAAPAAATKAATKGAPRALAVGDEVRSKIAREVSIAEGEIGTVAEVRDGVTVIAITSAEQDKRWLIVDEECEPTAAAAPAEGGEPAPEEEPAAIATLEALAARYPALVAEARTAAVTEERTRVAAVIALAPKAISKALKDAITSGATEGDAAKAFLAASRDPATNALAAIAGAEESIEAPVNTDGRDNAKAPGAETTSLLEQFSPRRRASRARTN